MKILSASNDRYVSLAGIFFFTTEARESQKDRAGWGARESEKTLPCAKNARA
jgi:hypothetical protein